MIKKTKIFLAIFFTALTAVNAEVFTIGGIQINGLQRISRGTVLSYLPAGVRVGSSMESERSANIIRALYDTNFFSDVAVKRSGNILIINVVERAVIGSLKVSGNKKLSKQQLMEALKNVGIAEGQELNLAILKGMEHAIGEQYRSMGLYNTKIAIEVKDEDSNRVTVAINIVEGPRAKIKSINIIGNEAFKQNILLRELTLSKTKPWSFLTGSDQYSKEKLEADLEKLRSYYMDRGYLKVNVETSKVLITPDKKNIYITIKIVENSIYRFSRWEINGDLLNRREEIFKLVTIKSGDIFSRKAVIEIQANIAQLLGNDGYAMAEIRPDYGIDDNLKKVWIKFTIKPNHRVYLRKINFMGNNRTNDEVLRREMRLQEGGLFSTTKINESTRRLANLGYIKDIEHRIVPVAGANNQADLHYSVKEDTAISMQLQAGLSDKEGFLYGMSVRDQNVFGTGKSASIQFDNTKAHQSYGISYYDPYFTTDKIGLAVNGYVHKNNPNKISDELSSYRSSTYGVNVAIDIPISDYTQIVWGVGMEHIGLGHAHDSIKNTKMEKFIEDYGTSFNQIKLSSSLGYSNMDRAIFPTSGFAHSLSIDGYLPFNKQGLLFYKADYVAKYYRPLIRDFILRLSGELGYGDGLCNTKILPPFRNFFAGGIGTVRGFDADTIGSEEDKDRVIGANLLTVASASIIIPIPAKDVVRPSIFVDVGSVHDRSFSASDLRASYGIQIEWRTPLAPLVFSFAKPMRKKAWDNAALFQFSLGANI